MRGLTLPSRKAQIQALLARATSNPIVGRPVQTLVRKGLVPEAVWMRLPVEQTFDIRLPDGSAFAYASTKADFVGRSVYWRGLDGYEGETTRIYCRLARRARTIVDVGANTGFFTLMACSVNPAARVIAFEPVPRVCKQLRAEIALNGWTERCEVHQAAVSNQSGTVTMHIPLGELPHSASLNPEGFLGVRGDLIEASARTLDEHCAGVDGVDLVKIDVEGFEDKVLGGMQGLLATSAPTVIFEVIPGGPAGEIEGMLSRFGYRFYHLRQDGPVRIKTIAPDPGVRDRNYIAVASDEAERLLQA